MVEKELDFTEEGRNAAYFTENLPKGIGIPRILYAHPNLLIQQKVSGKRVSEIANPKLTRRFLDRLRNHFMRIQIMRQGLYHSDLQPGNVLFDERRDKIWILDFGQVGSLSLDERSKLDKFISAARERNPVKMIEALEGMGAAGKNYRSTQLKARVGALCRTSPSNLSKIFEVVTPLFRACHDAGLQIDLPYLQLLKGIATFDATERSAA